MSKNIKKVLSLFLCLTLVVTLGASAFADGPKNNGRDKDAKSGTVTTQEDATASDDEKDDVKHDSPDDEDEFSDDELDDAFTFDMSEIFDQIIDPEERANVESLYEDYMQAYDEETQAYEKMISAEDAFFDALNSAEMSNDFEMPENEDSSIPSEEEFDETLEDMQDLNLNEILDILMQFISWYNSINNNSDTVESTPQPSSTPQSSSSQPSLDSYSMS